MHIDPSHADDDFIQYQRDRALERYYDESSYVDDREPPPTEAECAVDEMHDAQDADEVSEHGPAT